MAGKSAVQLHASAPYTNYDRHNGVEVPRRRIRIAMGISYSSPMVALFVR